MENPGLRRHSEAAPQFIKVTQRRTAVVITTPSPISGGGPAVPNEPATRRDNITTPPPLMGSGVSTPSVPATNGAPPLDVNPTQNNQTRAQDDRRIQQQQQVGGGEKENPAYQRAQQSVQNKIQTRRAHPLHQGSNDNQEVSLDSKRGLCETCWLKHGEEIPQYMHSDEWDQYDPEHPHVFKPFESHPGQRFSSYLDDDNERLEIPWTGGRSISSPGPMCETCWLRDGHKRVFPSGHKNDPDKKYDHEFKPMAMEPGQRYSVAPSGWDSVEPEDDAPQMPGGGSINTFGPLCERCWLHYGIKNPSSDRHGTGPGYYYPHEFKPMEQEQRFSAVSSDDDDYWNGSDYASAGDCQYCGSSDVDGIPGHSHCYNCGHTDTAQQELGPMKTRDFSTWDQETPYGDHLKPGVEEVRPGFGRGLLEDVKRGPGNIPSPRMQSLNSTRQATDLWKEFGERPEDREETVPTDEQAQHLEGMGFNPYADDDGTPYWMKHHQGNEYMIGPSRDEPRGGYWETSIGPIGHSAEFTDEPVRPTVHRDFTNAVQRMTDPDGWAKQHMMDQDMEDVEGGYLHAPRRPGKTREFDPHLRDQVTHPPDRRIDFGPDKQYGHYKPRNPGIQSLNKAAASEPIECEGCGEIAHPDGTRARFRQGDWESGFYHKPCFDWANREVIDDPESWQFGNDASRGHQFTSRVAAQVPHDDPVYPYSGRVDPDDTVDLDNLQEGNDESRPNLSASSLDPRLIGANEILNQYPDTEEGERGAGALGMGLNTIFDSVKESEGLPYEERLQRGKDALDAHFEASQLTHKEHVKRLHEDWEARGGHKTGEPRPVERFSPRYTKPQQIVPDPSNPFPELESPILYAGKCEGCGKKLYDSADSSGDPRGALGDHTVGTLDAAEYDATDVPGEERTGDRRMHGPSALICPDCDQDQDRQEYILDKYRGHKAGERTGGGYWGVPFGAPAGAKREFIPTTYGKDRKGKWHNPGEKVGSCPECDQGITGFHYRGQTPGPMQAEAAWNEALRNEAGLKDDFVDAFRDVRDWSADKPWSLGIVRTLRDAPESLKALRNSGLYDEDGNVVKEPYEPKEFRSGLTWRDIKSKPRNVRMPVTSSWDMLDDRPEGFNLSDFYQQQGMRVRPNEDMNLAFLRDRSAPHLFGEPIGNPSGRTMFSVQPSWYAEHDENDTADPDVSIGDEKYQPSSFDPETEPCQDCWVRDENLVGRGQHGLHEVDHPYRSMEKTDLSRFGSAEDDEWWDQQPDVIWSPGNPSVDAAAGYYDDEANPHTDDDLEDTLPDNMSLRDHTRLMNYPGVAWDGDDRYPRYTTIHHRRIIDSDGRPAHAEEHHVIEHNTVNRGPSLPSEDNPDPHVSSYPWSHTYYPAGQTDQEGLTKGYNTVDQALHAQTQLSLFGARHPGSKELLKGYRYVGNEMPYDPSVELPHEAAARMNRTAAGPRYEYGSCPVCDAEIDEPCTSTRQDTWGKPISRVHPEREKKPIGKSPEEMPERF